MYTFEQLKDDVRKEAEALRVHATKEELGRLDIETLDPEALRKCIYGCMTGHCHSDRAIDLIGKCACRYFKDAHFADIKDEGFDRIARKVNGTSVPDLYTNRKNEEQASVHYSAIEAYILLPEANNASLISYLRGETETLTL
jgi:hypothetical protein